MNVGTSGHIMTVLQVQCILHSTRAVCLVYREETVGKY